MIDNSKLNACAETLNAAIKFHEDRKNGGTYPPSNLDDLMCSVQNLQVLMKQVLELLRTEEKANAKAEPHKDAVEPAPSHDLSPETPFLDQHAK